MIWVLSAGLVLYVGGGVAHHYHQGKAVTGRFAQPEAWYEALPHREQWAEFFGLVRDGMAFTGAHAARALGREEYSKLGGGTEASGQTAQSPEMEAALRRQAAAEEAWAKLERPAQVGGKGVLHAAVKSGRERKLKELIKGGGKGELDLADDRGLTPYHSACSLGQAECVRCLVRARCNTALTNRAGKTGWELAAAVALVSRSQPNGWAETCGLLAKYAKKKHAALACEAEKAQAEAAVLQCAS